ncbi:MAG: hypothetical protein GY861_01840, partial [bacterium]|nr:hypothetical protein [bacterium]
MSAPIAVTDLQVGPMIKPITGRLKHIIKKATGKEFYFLEDNAQPDPNSVMVNFWSCSAPDIPVGPKLGKMVTIQPELKAGKGGNTASNVKVTEYNGNLQLNINPGGKITIDEAVDFPKVQGQTFKDSDKPNQRADFTPSSNGARVGMIVNNACQSLTAQKIPLTCKGILEVAEEI